MDDAGKKDMKEKKWKNVSEERRGVYVGVKIVVVGVKIVVVTRKIHPFLS